MDELQCSRCDRRLLITVSIPNRDLDELQFVSWGVGSWAVKVSIPNRDLDELQYAMSVVKSERLMFQSLIGIWMNCNTEPTLFPAPLTGVSIPNRDLDELQLCPSM